MHDEGICRTAPATPGMLITLKCTGFFQLLEKDFYKGLVLIFRQNNKLLLIFVPF